MPTKKQPDQIPNTLELTDRAELAIHHLTSNVDPALNYAPYFYANMTGNPPNVIHDTWDWGDVTARYIDACISLRQMTGSKTGIENETRLRELLLSTLCEKTGLSYRPVTPWSDYEAGMFDQGRTLTALATWYMATRDKAILKRIDRFVEGMWNVAIHIVRKDRGYAYCYYPYTSYRPDGWNSEEAGEATHYGGGCDIFPLAKVLEITGSPLAGSLTERLVNFILKETLVFEPDGRVMKKITYPCDDHLHSKSLTVLGILKYALVTGQKDLIEWSKKAYEHIRPHGTTFGWFPEGIAMLDRTPTPHSETCCTADIIEIAIQLAKNGYPEYWGDVERFSRNSLMESQVTNIGWIQEREVRKKATKRERYMGVAGMMLGGFVGRCLPHDFIADGFLMGCCCGAGARAIYQVWDAIMDFEDGRLRVNLLLNRRSPWADIESFLPYQGKILIRNKKASSLSVRIPEWVTPEKIVAEIDDKRKAFSMKDGFACFRTIRPGDEIVIAFPIETVNRKESIQKWDFDVIWRGDTVIGVSPEGTKRPLYRREAMNTDQTPFRKLPTTHVAKTSVHW